MLIEIRSDKFRTERIEFHSGLNVILGDENATNSIGKSTLLMVIDFAFGGRSLLDHNRDLTVELGEHDYFFSFGFDGEIYRFRRGTFQPDVIYKCDVDYQVIGALSLDQYTAFLRAAYKISIEDITFRSLVGLFFRVWGKDNLNVHKPLHIVQSQSGKDCVTNLIRMFDRYSQLKTLSEELKRKEDERNALLNAFKNQIIPRINTSDYRQNERQIRLMRSEIEDIKAHLAKYATNIAEVVNREVLELKLEKDKLLSTKLTLESQLARTQRNIAENRHIKSKYFTGLIEYFPEIDQARLANVEEFHSGVTRHLRTELHEAEKQLKDQLARVGDEVSAVDSKMSQALSSIEQPSHVVDRVYDLATSLESATVANTHFETEIETKKAIEGLSAALSSAKGEVLSFIQSIINDGMQRVVRLIFGPEHKSPTIAIRESGYTFEVFEDTGTGTAYVGLIVFDLTIFQATALPVIAHDSLLFKNIENDSVANIFRIYLGIEKQSFVAIDEIQKYGAETATALRNQSVIQLDDNNVLYIKDWRRKTED